MFLPVVDIDVGNPANEELKLSLIENIDKLRGNELVEAGDECVELFFDTLLDAPFGDEATLSEPRNRHRGRRCLT